MKLREAFKKIIGRETKYVESGNGDMTIVVEGTTYQIPNDHPNIDKIRACIANSEDSNIPFLLDISKNISSVGDIKFDANIGQVTYKGKEIDHYIAERITEFWKEGISFEPLMAFLDNLMRNPSRKSVEDLYNFLEHSGIEITSDGHFVAYKGIRSDFMDIYSGKFDNSPGKVLEMNRNEVDDDSRIACSYGFHVGSYNYASSWSEKVDKVVLVKVNPADAVSVPYDHSCEKLRVCRYEVVREIDCAIEDAVVYLDECEDE